jgi:hypothetical protein
VRGIVAWTLAAVAGLVLAVAISYAASTLSSQHVGLSSEPLSAGDRLVPRATRTPTARPTASPTATRTSRPPTATPTSVPPAATPTSVPPPATPTAPPRGGEDSGGGDD